MMQNFVDLLPGGEANAVPLRQLVAMTGLTEREVRRRIADERRAGALILSSVDPKTGGYYVAQSADELRRFINSMSQRGRSTFAVLKAARAALAQLEAEGGEEAEQGGEDGAEGPDGLF